ncbi:MAG: ABC transporter permease [Chloroflexota bacterium]|jgi:multiple sugar transport system permease protein|nr:carbohydrate ABC transporter permease [Caldilinea sp.]GIK75268.1 MAG: ABC transporter permease [Chloroflexota bacterium]
MSTATTTTAERAAVHTSAHSLWRNKAVRTVFYHLMVAGFGIVMLYPILWLFASSFKGRAEIWTNVSSLIPQQFTLENYVNGWRGFGGISFTTFYANSFIYAGIGTLLAVLASALVAYGFARIQFSGRRFWFACMLATLMLPVQVQIIPQYIVFSQLGWINTFYPLLLPRIGGQAFFIFMIMQFIRGIPRDLDEAAEMDGCGRGGIFFRIILPQITPALITAAIFSFYWTWEDFLTPLIYLNAPRLYTVSLALRAFADPSGTTDWGAIFAMSSLSLAPVFAIFVFFQRFLVEGISTTGLKG